MFTVSQQDSFFFSDFQSLFHLSSTQQTLPNESSTLQPLVSHDIKTEPYDIIEDAADDVEDVANDDLDVNCPIEQDDIGIISKELIPDSSIMETTVSNDLSAEGFSDTEASVSEFLAGDSSNEFEIDGGVLGDVKSAVSRSSESGFSAAKEIAVSDKMDANPRVKRKKKKKRATSSAIK